MTPLNKRTLIRVTLTGAMLMILGMVAWLGLFGGRTDDTEANIFPDPLRRTNQHLRQLDRLTVMYDSAKGKSPASLDNILEMTGLSPGAIASRKLTEDAWQHRILVRVRSRDIELRSVGADGKPDTEDDVILLVPRIHDRI